MSSASKSEVLKFKDKLYTLEAAMSEERMAEVFAPLVREYWGAAWRVQHVRIEVMRRRNQRCVLRYRVHAQDTQSGEQIEWRVIGKVFKADRGEPVFENMRQLWDYGFRREAQDHISIPEPLSFSTSMCMLFQEEVGGVPVKNILRKSPQPEHMRQVARTLAKLHQSPLVPGKPFTVKDHLTRCHPRHEFLSLACPNLADTVAALINGAHEVEASYGDYQRTTLHGDFHLGQVHIEDENVWLIDFDALSYGDPASDLGNLLVFLKGKIKRQPEMRELIDVFLDEYFSIMEPAIAHRIPLYEGLTHLRRACKCLRMQEEGWERRVKRMVEMGLACIVEMKTTIITPDSAFFKSGYDDEEVDELELQEVE